MVKQAYISLEVIPSEQWWQDPTAWIALEHGLRQAQAKTGRSLGSFTQYPELEIDDYVEFNLVFQPEAKETLIKLE